MHGEPRWGWSQQVTWQAIKVLSLPKSRAATQQASELSLFLALFISLTFREETLSNGHILEVYRRW